MRDRRVPLQHVWTLGSLHNNAAAIFDIYSGGSGHRMSFNVGRIRTGKELIGAYAHEFIHRIMALNGAGLLYTEHDEYYEMCRKKFIDTFNPILSIHKLYFPFLEK